MSLRRALPLIGAAGAGILAARAASGPTLVRWPVAARVGVPILCGLAAAGVGAAAAGAVAAVLPGPRRTPSRTAAAVGAIGGILAGGVIAAGVAARGPVIRRLIAEGAGQETAFAMPPANPSVSGSPPSAVPISTLGREGARFVWSATSTEAIAEVTGRPAVASPIRVFVGYSSAPSVEERVALALDELHRTGALDRAHLLIQAPAGSGYANSTPVEVLETLTGGDCATVVIGYGLLPSFLSLRRVPVAAQTQRLLLEAISALVAGRPAGARPTLHLYGESLGAEVQQAALPMGTADLDHAGISSALWVGTPGGGGEFRATLTEPCVVVDRPAQLEQIAPGEPVRAWFLEHDGDPVVRFRTDLLTRCPDWLAPGEPRGRHVPEGMRWRPGITWLQVGVDTLFATDIKPGDFHSLGHDYRADLGRVTTSAFGLPADPSTLERLESYLRRAEVARASLIEGSGAVAG